MTIKFLKFIYYLKGEHPHTGLSQQRSSLRNSPKFSHRRNVSSFGRLFHTRTPSCAKDLSPYLDVLDLGTTSGLVLLIEYLEVFSSMRFLMKEGDILFTILNTSHAMRFSRLTWRYWGTVGWAILQHVYLIRFYICFKFVTTEILLI